MELFLNLLLLVAILGGSAWFTNWFTKKMYNRCSKCGALNAHRRRECRLCSSPLTNVTDPK